MIIVKLTKQSGYCYDIQHFQKISGIIYILPGHIRSLGIAYNIYNISTIYYII